MSDKGLHDLASMLGAEWLRLASVLRVPGSIVEQIRLDNPNSTRLQIFQMLKLWRDTKTGTKEQLKGALHEALVEVERQDLAEDILLEQVEGSAEKVAYRSCV